MRFFPETCRWCKTCWWWEPIDRCDSEGNEVPREELIKGICHRYPPQGITRNWLDIPENDGDDPLSYGMVSLFARTRATDWCGEWKLETRNDD
jgi:hypothetical protein